MKKMKEKIHPKAHEVLETKLKAELESAKIEKGYPDTKLGGNWGWEFAKEASKQIKALSVGNAWGILYDQVKNLFDELDYAQRPSGNLIDILNSNDQNKFIKRTLKYFRSFPRSYTIYFRLIGGKNAKWENTKVSKSIDLVTVSKKNALLKLKRGWESDNSLVQRILDRRNEDGQVFYPGNVVIRIRAQGFGKDSIEDSAVAEAFSALKSLIVLGEISDVFTHARNYSFLGGPIKADLFFSDDTEGSKIVNKISLPDEVALLLAGYSLATRDKKGLLDVKGHLLQKIGQLIDAPTDDENRTPIVTAAEWSFDSKASSNQTVSFIQLCIALEAILGDDKLKEGLTKTLADRCAYSLGPTAKSRKEIRGIFENLYDQRSKIVHGRKTKIDEDAIGSLGAGEWLLLGVLRKELRNFEISKPSKEAKATP